MAVVGEAQIIVRAIGTRVAADITNIFNGLDKVGASAGNNMGKKFTEGFNKSGSTNAVGKLADALKKMNPEAVKARETWQKLTKTGFVLGPTITGLIGTISALIGSLVSVVGAAGAAGAAIVVLGNVFAGFGLAMMSAKIALGGVMAALGKMGKGGGAAAKNTDAIRLAQERLAQVIEQNNENLFQANQRITEAQINLNQAFEAGREELQQLGFAAEEAALAQQGAALDLERAREELARVQDLPPNSRIRREAELAFAQAELQYRQAVDANADLAAEQERYAQSGVEGTQAVIDARRELADAEADLARTVRDGLRAQLEAERALEEARKNRSGGGANPFEGLTKSQIEFVKRMYALKPLFKDLQEQIASAFLPLLGDAIENFANNVLPTVGDGLSNIAEELGLAADRTSKFLSSSEGLSLLRNFFADTARLIAPMADAFGYLMQIFLKLMHAAAPQAERFVNWIRDAFDTFNKYLDTLPSEGPGSLSYFFEQAGNAAAEFGDLFGEVFRWIGQIIGANLGDDSPGREFVRWMTDGLKAANDLRDSVGGSGLKDYFAAVNANVKPLLQFLGDMGKILIDMGANPAIGQVFEILRQAEPSIRQIAMSLLNAAPSLAQLVVKIVEVLAAFTDTGQITAFFDTLTSAVSVVADLVKQEWFMKLMQQISPLLGTILALQSVFNGLKFAFNVLVGSLIGLLSIVGSVWGAFSMLGKAGSYLAGVFSGGKGLMTGIAGLIGGVKALLGFLGRAGLVGIIISVIAGFIKFAAASKPLQTALKFVGDSIGRIFGAVMKLMQPIGDLFTIIGDFGGAILGGVIGVGLTLLGGLFDLIAKALEGLYNWLKPAIDGFKAIADFLSGSFFGQVNEGISKLLEFFGIKVPKETTDSANSLATGIDNVGSSASGATPNINTTADAIDGIGSSAASATPQVGGLSSGFTALKTSAINAKTANLDFRDSVSEFKNALGEAEKKVLDNSKAGRENQRTFLDMAQAVQAKMQADIDAGVPLDEVNDKYRKNYEAMYKNAVNAGFAKDEAKKFIDQILKTPSQIAVELKVADLNIKKVQQRIDAAVRAQGIPVIAAGMNATVRIQARGGFNTYDKAFASGGMAEGIYRSMARPLYKFAEPETGWEAFISGRKGSEERNRGIVREAASRLGMNMGGVSIVVNPAPGMDERALAGAVSQEITKLMRKGSIH